jgi:phosphatidylserine decarboxylase
LVLSTGQAAIGASPVSFASVPHDVMANIFSHLSLPETALTSTYAKAFRLSKHVVPALPKVHINEAECKRWLDNVEQQTALCRSAQYWGRKTESLLVWQTEPAAGLRRLLTTVQFARLLELDVRSRTSSWILDAVTWQSLLRASPQLVAIHFENVDTSRMIADSHWHTDDKRGWKSIVIHGPQRHDIPWKMFLGETLQCMDIERVLKTPLLPDIDLLAQKAPNLHTLCLDSMQRMQNVEKQVLRCLETWPKLQKISLGKDSIVFEETTVAKMFHTWRWLKVWPLMPSADPDIQTLCGISVSNQMMPTIIDKLPKNQLNVLRQHSMSLHNWSAEDWTKLLHTSDQWEKIDFRSCPQDMDMKTMAQLVQDCASLRWLNLAANNNARFCCARMLEALCDRKMPCPVATLSCGIHADETTITLDHLLSCIRSPMVTSLSLGTTVLLTQIGADPNDWRLLQQALANSAQEKHIVFSIPPRNAASNKLFVAEEVLFRHLHDDLCVVRLQASGAKKDLIKVAATGQRIMADRKEERVVSLTWGVVERIEETADHWHVRIYLSPEDMHDLHAPVTGVVSSITTVQGTWTRPVFKSWETKRGRLQVWLHHGNHDQPLGFWVEVGQGYITDTVHFEPDKGDSVLQSERVGRIVIGSLAEVQIPKSWGLSVVVRAGEVVHAGQTILAK